MYTKHISKMHIVAAQAAERRKDMKSKKIISGLCAGAVMMSGISAYAKDSDLDFLKKEYKSFEGKIKISAKLNKPLDILSKIPVGENYIDLQKLVESALNSTGEYNCKAIMELDNSKMQMEMTGKSNIPLSVNRNLDVDINARQGVWLNIDLSDEENPVYETIMQNPIFDKYIYMDMTSDMLYVPASMGVIGGADGPTSIYVISETADDSESAAVIGGADEPTSIYTADGGEDEIITINTPIDNMKNILNRDTYSQIQNSSVEAMKKNSTVKKSGRNVTVTFTDKGLKQFLADTFKTALEQTGGNYSSMLANNEEIGSTLKKLFDVPVFNDSEALKIEYVLGADDYVKTMKSTLNIKTNVFDLVMAAGGSDAIEMKRDNSNIDLTIYTEAEYTSVNGKVNVSLPELTEENTFNPLEPGDTVGIEDGAFDYSKCSCEYYDLYIGAAKIDGNKVEFPLRSAFDGVNIEYNNGRITITKDEQHPEDYEWQWYGGCFDKTAVLNIGSNIVFVDDKAITVSDAPYICDDITYISNRLIEEISGLRLNYLDGVPEEGSIGFSANYEKLCDYCKEFFAEPSEV